MSSEKSKEIVGRWFAAGVSSPAGQAMVTDDFRWIGPSSMAFMFGTEDGALHGPEGLATLPWLDEAIYRGYEESPDGMGLHFMIAEGDRVVMEFDAVFTTWEGEAYHNQYCLVIRLQDDRIAEVREHVDSLYSWNVVFGTPEKYAGVMDRLARLRRGEKLA